MDAIFNRLIESKYPATVVDLSSVLIGVRTFEAGEGFPNHYHEATDEYFVVLEGEMALWKNRQERYVLVAGDAMACHRGVQHYLLNSGKEAARLLYVKSPNLSGDSIVVEWYPEQ